MVCRVPNGPNRTLHTNGPPRNRKTPMIAVGATVKTPPFQEHRRVVGLPSLETIEGLHSVAVDHGIRTTQWQTSNFCTSQIFVQRSFLTLGKP